MPRDALPPKPVPKELLCDERLPVAPVQPVHFFLLDQPELRGQQPDRRLEPPYQHIAAAGHAKPLTAQETRNYVERGLRATGWQHDPAIDAPVFHIIHQSSEGVPDRINLICNHLLLQCFVEQRHRITGADACALVQALALEKSTSRKQSSQEQSAPPPPSQTLAEEQIWAAPSLKEGLAVELLKPEPVQPSDTSVKPSPQPKAQFESRNLPRAKYRARRRDW